MKMANMDAAFDFMFTNPKDDGGVSITKNTLMQDPKLTFLGRRQLATEFFFSVAIWKNVVAKKCQ